MTVMFQIALLICLGAAIVSEIVTIAVPRKILGMSEIPPEDVLKSGFYRFVFVLSGLYLTALVMMLLSGIETFRYYALILLFLSFSAWLIRNILLRNRFLQIAESTICLVLLFDTARTIMRGFRS